MKEQIILFIHSERGQRLQYEIKSFLMTFAGILVALVGAEKFTSISMIMDSKDAIIGSLGIAFSRTVLIYLFNWLGLGNYRELTKQYK